MQLNNERNLEEILFYRYEMLWRIQEEQTPISIFGIFVHGVLLLTITDEITYEVLIDSTVDEVIQDLRFVIYYSDLNHVPNLQQDSLTLSEVCEILTRYNFRNGFENSIEISGSNLLNTCDF